MNCPVCKTGELQEFGKFKDYKCDNKDCSRFFSEERLIELGVIKVEKQATLDGLVG